VSETFPCGDAAPIILEDLDAPSLMAAHDVGERSRDNRDNLDVIDKGSCQYGRFGPPAGGDLVSWRWGAPDETDASGSQSWRSEADSSCSGGGRPRGVIQSPDVSYHLFAPSCLTTTSF